MRAFPGQAVGLGDGGQGLVIEDSAEGDFRVASADEIGEELAQTRGAGEGLVEEVAGAGG